MKRGRTKAKDRRMKDVHHYFWPKKLYKKRGVRNRVLEMSYDFHHGYHNHFMFHCKEFVKRTCRNGSFCSYEGICCYRGTSADYGEAVI